MSKTKRNRKRKVLGAKMVIATLLMCMMLMAESVVSTGNISSMALFSDTQLDVSHATKVLHQVVRLLTYSLPG